MLKLLSLPRLAACLALPLTLLIGPPAARAAEIVDTAYVTAALARGAIVWDVRDAKAYADGHLPGAVNVGDVAAVLRDPNREDWVPAAQVQAVLGKAGIDLPNREVIVYGRTGDPFPYWVQSGLRDFGAKSSKVFHGGLDAWQAAGQPVSKEAVTLPPVALTLRPVAGELIGTPQLLAPSAEAQRDTVDTFLAREDVRKQFEALGVDPAEARLRVAGLTEAELAQLSGRIDELPAGAGAVEVVLLVLIILLILELAGAIDIFKKV